MQRGALSPLAVCHSNFGQEFVFTVRVILSPLGYRSLFRNHPLRRRRGGHSEMLGGAAAHGPSG